MGLTKKHFGLAAKWIPTIATYSSTGGLAVLYFTDWKLVLQFLPYYNGKFKNEGE